MERKKAESGVGASGLAALSQFQKNTSSNQLASHPKSAQARSALGAYLARPINFKFSFFSKKPVSQPISLCLDIGFTKVQLMACMPAQDKEKGLNVLAVVEEKHWAFDESCSVDPDELQRALRLTLDKMRLELKQDLPQSVYVSASFHNVKIRSSYGVLALRGKKVDEGILAQVHDVASAVQLPESSQLLHVLSENYYLDSFKTSAAPLELEGVRLEANVNLVTVDKNIYSSLLRCLSDLNLQVKDVLWQPLATATSCLSYASKKHGMVCVDIRGLCTNVCIFYGGSLIRVFTIPFGGESMTYDICSALSICEEDAIRLKEQEVTLKDLDLSDAYLTEEQEDRLEQVFVAADLIKARLKDLFDVISYELKQSDVKDKISGGVVFSGGTSFMSGFLDFAKENLDCHVRLAENMLATQSGSGLANQLSLLGLAAHFLNRKTLAKAEKPTGLNSVMRHFNRGLSASVE